MSAVVDASVVIDFLTQSAPPIDLNEIVRSGRDLHVPAVCDTEVVSAISRWVRRGGASEEQGWEALADYVAFPVSRHLHPQLLGRVYELRANVSATDASYVALAEALEVDLLTTDRALASAVRTHTSVTVVP